MKDLLIGSMMTLIGITITHGLHLDPLGTGAWVILPIMAGAYVIGAATGLTFRD